MPVGPRGESPFSPATFQAELVAAERAESGDHRGSSVDVSPTRRGHHPTRERRMSPTVAVRRDVPPIRPPPSLLHRARGSELARNRTHASRVTPTGKRV